MAGAQRDQSALNVVEVGFADNSDVTSEVLTAESDLQAAGFDNIEHFACLTNVAIAIGTPTADDTVEATFTVNHSDVSGSGFVVADTKTVVVSGAKAEGATADIAATCPVNSAGLKRYVKVGVTFAMGAGATGTLTTATGSALLQKYPNGGQPEADYDLAGYFK